MCFFNLIFNKKKKKVFTDQILGCKYSEKRSSMDPPIREVAADNEISQSLLANDEIESLNFQT